mgnify:CR=1 FL=1
MVKYRLETDFPDRRCGQLKNYCQKCDLDWSFDDIEGDIGIYLMGSDVTVESKGEYLDWTHCPTCGERLCDARDIYEISYAQLCINKEMKKGK